VAKIPQVKDVVNRSNRTLFIVCLIGLAVVIIGIVMAQNYYYNVFSGPFPISKSQAFAINSLDGLSQYYVTLNLSSKDVLDTGYQYVTTDNGVDHVDAYYYAVRNGDHFLLVKSQNPTSETQYTGGLIPLPADVQREVIGGLEKDDPGISVQFLPFMLDAGNFKSDAYLGMAGAALIGAVCLFGLFLGIRRTSDASAHPIMKALKRYGEPDSVANQIDYEMGGSHQVVGNLHLTPNWVVWTSGLNYKAVRVSDVMWFYKLVTQHRTYGVPTRKTFTALIWDRYGVCLRIPNSESVVNGILQTLAQGAPTAVAGYSSEVEQTWKKNRAQFIAVVDGRRMGSVVSTPQR
jgi:uncharacterized protein DUF6709